MPAHGSTKVVGLTGRIACGKSQVGVFLHQLGCTVIDADKLGHESYRPGSDCFKQVVAAFGEQVVGDDGQINRPVLGGIVFSDPAQLERLNAIVWPDIRRRVDERVAKAAAEGARVVVVEAAVLLQAGWHTSCDQVWVVTADRSVARTRLMARNNLSGEEADKRINSQVDNTPDDAIIIENNAGFAELARAVKGLYATHLAPTAPTDEQITRVDADNNVIGQVARSDMRAGNLWHRATFIVVKNDKDELYVQKRTWLKDYCPGAFDPVTGGVVAAGEDYEPSAARELEEELGVSGVPLTFMGTFKYADEHAKVWGGLFEARWNGSVTPQLCEVERVEMMTMETIKRRAAAGTPFCPDSLHALDVYAARKAAKLRAPRRVLIASLAVAALGGALFCYLGRR